MIDRQDSLLLLTPNAEQSANVRSALETIGFVNQDAAVRRFQSLCENDAQRQSASETLPALLYALLAAATPDRSLVNFERFVQSVPDRQGLYARLARQPRAVEILVKLFVGSQFLTEILLRNPHYLEWLTEHKRLAEFKSRSDFYDAGLAASQEQSEGLAWPDQLRRFQQWELLRIAACDTFGLMDLKTVTLQLALLADALVQLCLHFAAREEDVDPSDFAVIAFGKLGGEELNYSSDIDLVFVCRRQPEAYWRLGQKLIRALSDPTELGFLYRVDMRLRPWGRSGALVTTADAYLSYLEKHGKLWEKQASLKARAIAGSQELGEEVLQRMEPIIFTVDPDHARETVADMKGRIETQLEKRKISWGEVKNGPGGIRDVEFVTQYLQLVHGRDLPAVRSINTLDGLVRLADHEVIQPDEYRRLTSGYVFQRTIEHALQLMHNKQEHTLPDNMRGLDYLAQRLDFPGAEAFVQHYEQHRVAVRAIYSRHVLAQQVRTQKPPAAISPSVDVHFGNAAAVYRQVFNQQEADRHLQLLNQLNDESPIVFEVESVGPDRWELTIAGFDQLGYLSIMSGLLFVYGFDIISGYVFTGAEVKAARERRATRPSGGKAKTSSARKFVNVFELRPTREETNDEVWTALRQDLIELFHLSRENGEREAQGRLVRRVAAIFEESDTDVPALLPVEIDIDNGASSDATVMHIQAEDTPGFLYELTAALAVSGIAIVRVLIQSSGNQVIDALHISDAHGRKIEDPDRINELRAAVVLIKHFTHLLPRSPNPEAALLHFRDFLENLFRQPNWLEQLASLNQTDVLEALARLLGVSDFLWEDFLRLQHANLFPVVTDVQGLQQPKDQPALREALAAELDAVPPEDRREILNAFKDREMMRVDMRHILGLQGRFGMFSRELTDVAEVVVEAAWKICDEALVEAYGTPQLPDGTPCPIGICALGKCGGQELGYASDIELMFLFEADGSTSGPQVISNLEYYQRLVEQFRKTIDARRKGIFEVDLRLRPYGNAGSLAVSLETFEKYFGADGPAWPYERQALVKLRPIAGDPAFCQQIVELRDRIIYRGERFDIAAMRAMREKQLSQLVRAGTFNAKLSPGALVDCEYFVQALQITYGHLDPLLRQSNTREVMKALQANGILTEEERIRLRDAYRFMRRLIDALRMVRGDASDLTVPPTDSEEFEFLARRLGYGREAEELMHDLENHSANVLELNAQLDRRWSSPDAP